jgi:hypothetical protein
MFLFIMACWSKLSWCRKHVNPVQIIVRYFLFVLEISGGLSVLDAVLV